MKNLIVLPAYNERSTLPRTVAKLQELPASYEFLIVNDGSTDDTGEIADEMADRLSEEGRMRLRVVHLRENCGIGVAVQTGYLFAVKNPGYRYVIQFDSDGQHDVSSILDLVRVSEQRELDLCIGSRFIHDDPSGFRSTRLRRLGIRFFCRLLRLLSGVQVTDPTSGFRCAGPRAWKRFARRYPDDYPEPESLFWCLRHGLRVGEVPVRMHERQGGISSIRAIGSLYYMTKVTLAIIVDRIRRKEQLPE